MTVKEPPSLQSLDEALRRETAKLLLESEIWEFGSFGWLNQDDADPEFIGHAMWQTDAPSDPYLEFPFTNQETPPPQPQEWLKQVAISGADFCGLMETARETFGMLLFQAKLRRQRPLADNSLFDLHWMSTVIYLATASERLRDLFIASVFRTSGDQYGRGSYNGEKRRWYSSPFKEAAAMAKHLSVAENMAALLPMAGSIFLFQKRRNSIIHKVATTIGHRERRLLETPPRKPVLMDAVDFEQMKVEELATHERHIADTISELKECYFLLAKASNDVFVIENRLRNESRPA